MPCGKLCSATLNWFEQYSRLESTWQVVFSDSVTLSRADKPEQPVPVSSYFRRNKRKIESPMGSWVFSKELALLWGLLCLILN